MELLIRNAETKDTESVTELSNQLGYQTSNSDLQRRLNEIIINKDNCIYVAVENGKIIGWIHGFYSLRVESNFFVEIGGLVVSENYRRKGIGKKLVDKVIKWAELKNCGMIRVRCNIIRKESHRFYKNIGFKVNKEQKVFNNILN